MLELARTSFHTVLYSVASIVLVFSATLICLGMCLGIKGTISVWSHINASERTLKRLPRQ